MQVNCIASTPVHMILEAIHAEVGLGLGLRLIIQSNMNKTIIISYHPP